MRLSHSDLIPLLVIMGSGAVGVLGIFAFAAACGVPLPTAFQDDERDEAVIPPSVAEAAMSVQDLAGEPQFTPFTVAPAIQNEGDVIEAMERAYPPLLLGAGIGATV